MAEFQMTLDNDELKDALIELFNDTGIIEERIDHDAIVEYVTDSRAFSNAIDSRFEVFEPDTPDFGSWIMDHANSLPSDVSAWCSLGVAVRDIVAAVVTALLNGNLDGMYDELDEQLTRYRNADIKFTVEDDREQVPPESWIVVFTDLYGVTQSTTGTFGSYAEAEAYSKDNAVDSGSARIMLVQPRKP